jgi:soluble lytic murein transglycosylase-like protein
MRFCFILILTGILNAADPARVTTVIRPDPRTGRLVRSVVVSPKTVGEKTVASTVVSPRVVAPVPADAAVPAQDLKPPAGIDEAVERIAAEQALPAELLHSVIKVESNYNPYAVSPKGAQGLMQLIPATARRFGVSNAFNPLENIQGGARYLRYLLDLYNGNYPLALAAYNAGEQAVAKYGGVPPYTETQNYLVLVKKQLDKAAGARRAPAPPPPVVPSDPDAPLHIREIVETDGTVRYVSR